MGSTNWQDFFKDKLHDFQAVSFEHPSCNGNLYSALINHKIEEVDYISWAQDNLELPIVQADFFKNNPILPEFWAKWSESYPWSPVCLPIYEWDGTLMVGCIEIPKDFPSNIKAVFVLSYPTNLIQFWKKIVPTQFKEMFSALYPGFDIPNETKIAVSQSKETSPVQIKKANPVKVENIKPNLLPRFYLENLQKDETQTLKNELEKVFSQLSPFFDKLAFFGIDFNQSYTIPLVWSENVTPPDKIVPIDITERGVFKIVTSTSKPYHGYVTPNPFNEKFFKEWNNDEIPEHLTLLPLFCKNQIAGVLMGIGHSSAYNNQTLKQSEKMIKYLEERFKKLNTTGSVKVPSKNSPFPDSPVFSKPKKNNVA